MSYKKVSLFLFTVLFISTFLGGYRASGSDYVGSIRILRIIVLIALFAITLLLIFLGRDNSITFPRSIWYYFFFVVYAGLTILWAPRKLFASWKIFEIVVTLLIVSFAFNKLNIKKDPLLVYNSFFKLLKIALIGILITAIIFPDKGFQSISGSLFNFKLHGSLYTMNSNDVGFWSGLIFVNYIVSIYEKNKYDIFSIIIFSTILILSQSRSFIFTSLLIIIIYGILFSKNRIPSLLVLLILIGISIFYVRDSILVLFTRGSTDKLRTLHGRIYYWGIGIKYFFKNWMFGQGFYTGHRFLNLLYPQAKFSSNTFDSTWIDILVDTGLIGVSFVLTFLVRTFRKILQVSGFLNRQFVIGLIFLFVRSFIGPSFETFGLFLIYLLVIVFTTESINKLNQSEGHIC